MSELQDVIEKKMLDLVQGAEPKNRSIMTFKLASTALYFMDNFFAKGYHDEFLKEFMENVGHLYMIDGENKNSDGEIVH